MHSEHSMRRFFVLGGIVASAVLIVFGAASIYMGIDGRSEVRDSIAREKIVGTPDSSIAGDKVDTGTEAKTFAATIRKHTLEITGDRTYAEMGRYVTADGTETNDEKEAATDPKTGQPVANATRDLWVTSTALSTALNTSYFAEQVSTFAIVMGVALLLTGIGFAVLTLGVLRLPVTQVQVLPVRDTDRTATPNPA
ncbi:MAG: hypothetical protein KDC46_14025 [Thermoleophilia bacterium]|nr:hypothetical protein [Thermoleophilia bacterium]